MSNSEIKAHEDMLCSCSKCTRWMLTKMRRLEAETEKLRIENERLKAEMAVYETQISTANDAMAENKLLKAKIDALDNERVVREAYITKLEG